MNPTVSGGIQLPELTTPATEGQILTGRQAIDQNGEILTGSMPEITVPNPTISVSNSGVVTASSAYSAGHTNGGTASNTYQLTAQAAKTITPSSSSQTAVASGRYTTGAITVAGDSDLVASNIRSGINIFGVTGNYSGEEEVIEEIVDSNISYSGRYVYITASQPVKELKGLMFRWARRSSGSWYGYWFYPTASTPWGETEFAKDDTGIATVIGGEVNGEIYVTEIAGSSSAYISSYSGNQIILRMNTSTSAEDVWGNYYHLGVEKGAYNSKNYIIYVPA